MVNLLSWFVQELVIGNWRIFVSSLIQAILFFIAGIVIGKLVNFLLKKLSEKAQLNRTIRQSFINIFLVVVRWSIYILFTNIALKQLEIPELTSWLTSTLLVIPALVGALILIAIGFSIASYLKDAVEESKILNWQILSNLLFFFILYVFLVFALKTALISIDSMTVNIILIILTAIISAGIAIWMVKKKK